MTHIIDGRRVAADLHALLTTRIEALSFTPTLHVVLVGPDPASLLYVKNKRAAAAKIGIECVVSHLPPDITEPSLIDYIQHLNTSVDGIIVQLPLPAHIASAAVLQAVDPAADVDGFHPLNVGRLAAGCRRNTPCTPNAIMHLLYASQTAVHGVNALVVGAGAIVGRPVCTLLTEACATVTLAHKMTRDLAAECARSDIIIVAAGCPNLIRGAMIKPGAVIIDVGINRLPNGKICGDVAFQECLGIAGAITPVPGGVGPMTIACLLENTLDAAIARRG